MLNGYRFIIRCLGIIAVTSLACSWLPFLPISSPQVQSGDVLFWDDFRDPKSGWDTWSEDGSMVTYQDGGLRIFVAKPHYDHWSHPGKRFEEVRLAVEAVKLGGPDDNNYGLLCGYQNAGNYYSFLISSDGYAGIVKVKDGAAQIISDEMMTYSEVIRQGGATNFIGADCDGGTLVMHVNGFRLFETSDSDYRGGEIGVIAGSYQLPGVDIMFRNFVASKP